MTTTTKMKTMPFFLNRLDIASFLLIQPLLLLCGNGMITSCEKCFVVGFVLYPPPQPSSSYFHHFHGCRKHSLDNDRHLNNHGNAPWLSSRFERRIRINGDVFASSDDDDDATNISVIQGENRTTSINVKQQEQQQQPLKSRSKDLLNNNEKQMNTTSAILNISYDGSHFYGWSAANDGANATTSNSPKPFAKSGKSRRKRRTNGGPQNHKVRSIQGTIESSLCKIYGNVPKDLIKVEGCSRTDKGVHANSMIAHFYCRRRPISNHGVISDGDDELHQQQEEEEERVYQPRSMNDELFHPLPFNGDLSKISYVLNRILPYDIRINNICLPPESGTAASSSLSTPNKKNSNAMFFHPTTFALSKTYKYTFAVPNCILGSSNTRNNYHLFDPLRWRYVWQIDSVSSNHIDKSSSLPTGGGEETDSRMQQQKKKQKTSMPSSFFNHDKAKQAALLLTGKHDYSAFSGNYRGSERKQLQAQPKKNPFCHIHKITVEKEEHQQHQAVDALCTPSSLVNQGLGINHHHDSSAQASETYTVSITGNRFLYKMCRYLVGVIVSVGIHKIPLEEVEFALQNGRWDDDDDDSTSNNNINNKIECAPPHGLFLHHVDYGDEVELNWLET